MSNGPDKPSFKTLVEHAELLANKTLLSKKEIESWLEMARDETSSPENPDSSRDSDRNYIVTKLEQRVLARHGGKSYPAVHHTNLTESDSAMHFEAATCIKELVRMLTGSAGVSPTTACNEIERWHRTFRHYFHDGAEECRHCGLPRADRIHDMSAKFPSASGCNEIAKERIRAALKKLQFRNGDLIINGHSVGGHWNKHLQNFITEVESALDMGKQNV